MNTEDDPAADEFTENPDSPEGSGGIIDEDAIERFGRDLDDAEVAARALQEDEVAETAEPPVPPRHPSKSSVPVNSRTRRLPAPVNSPFP